MKTLRTLLLAVAAFAVFGLPAIALEKPGVTYKIFQFPPNKIPQIDGNTDDWAMVPADYVIGMDQLWDDSHKHDKANPEDLDVKVRVGWVKGLNRLYFLYEAYDNYWDFARTDLHNDTFELVVDGDLSGGPLIDSLAPKEMGPRAAYFNFQGVHAQNYHIFTPAEGKDWCMYWGPQQWLKKLPYANVAYAYNFKPGESGKLVLEFWITPFDYASVEGPAKSIESVLSENKLIGLCWAVMDYDDVAKNVNNGFWNLSPKHTMFGNASELCAFKLMPLEPQFRKAIDAQWSYKILSLDRRQAAFEDESSGTITSWKWEFGDGTTSSERNPIHTYEKNGRYVVVLYVEGPAGKSRLSKVWDIAFR